MLKLNMLNDEELEEIIKEYKKKEKEVLNSIDSIYSIKEILRKNKDIKISIKIKNIEINEDNIDNIESVKEELVKELKEDMTVSYKVKFKNKNNHYEELKLREIKEIKDISLESIKQYQEEIGGEIIKIYKKEFNKLISKTFKEGEEFKNKIIYNKSLRLFSWDGRLVKELNTILGIFKNYEVLDKKALKDKFYIEDGIIDLGKWKIKHYKSSHHIIIEDKELKNEIREYIKSNQKEIFKR